MFDILLLPFTLIIKYLFSFSQLVTFNNIGLALILLSFFVFVLTLPLTKFINKKIKNEELKKEKIKHLSTEINDVYKGQTRYFYTKTLYRIHGISSYADLYPLLKLFIQIPFFLAAYYYLLSNPILENESFLNIKDLSQQDQLLPFGGIYLNLLPLLMFVTNIISSYIFAKENKNERIALIGTGVLFLVLLYKMPAALVLYWTINNLISLSVEVIKSKEWIKTKINNFQLSSIKFDYINLITINIVLILIGALKLYFLQSYITEVKTTYFALIYLFALSVILVLLSYRYLNSSQRLDSFHLNIKQALFLFLGSLTPIFLMGKTNHEFIKDGLVTSFLSNLIVPALILSVISYIFLTMTKKTRLFINITFSIMLFFCLPMINHLLKITAETSFFYTALFIVLTYILASKIDKKFIPVVSILSLLAFITSSYEFTRTHRSRAKEENKFLTQALENKKTQKMFSVISKKLSKVEKMPSIYLLIYDGLTGKEVTEHYGLNYDLDFLNQSGFKTYGDILSYKETSVPTMSGILELSNKTVITKGWAQKFHMVGYNLVDKVIAAKNMPRTYMASKFFFKGLQPKMGSEVVKVGGRTVNSLLEGVLIGEFKFDLEIKKNFKSDDWKGIRRELIKSNKGFFYTHHPYPAHSQNSGKCLENEIDLYAQRRAKAIKSIKQDIVDINKHNPNSIIIIAGDHGGHLSGDCLAMKSHHYQNVTLPIFAETKGTFLAIKWPDKNYVGYDNIKNLQSLFHSVFAYILQDKEILNYTPKEDICLGDFCTTYDGKILKGKDQNKYIFDVLKNYELKQL